jgi:hypothetical protein
MRAISVSVETFAAIWSKRQAGEENENAILERILGVKKTEAAPSVVGTFDERAIINTQFGVRFEPGFEIFRIYKGRRRSAVVTDGRWLMEGKFYPSLHKLSEAVVEGRENSWANWKYRDPHGRELLIDNLRPEETVRRRQPTSR